jgi:YD repeat-containing protein
MTYDPHGNLLTRHQSGFTGTTAITATTTYTYNGYGQITSIRINWGQSKIYL